MLKRLIFFLLVSLLPAASMAQEKVPLPVVRPPYADGAVWNSARSICIDENGFVWVGTESGISRIDSRGTTSYNLGDDFPKGFSTYEIRKIGNDLRSSLYVCGSNNIGKVDLRTMTFSTVSSKGSKAMALTGTALVYEQEGTVFSFGYGTGTTKMIARLPSGSEITAIAAVNDSLFTSEPLQARSTTSAMEVKSGLKEMPEAA